MPAPALTTRRDFLRGQPLATGLPSMEDPTTPNSLGTTLGHDSIPPRSSLVCASRRAMGCCFELLLPTTTPAAFQACNAALDTIDRLEDQLTVYQDTSEVSRINRMASFTPVPVEPRLFELLETARRLTKSTEGAFDVAAGALVRAWGFLRGPKRVPPPDELAAALHQVGSHHVCLDRNRQTIAFLEPGVELNLGAIGKG